ncbi:type II toxin-antitoxin system death-on-curing family toxin [Agromyces aerolatus]|uniref:type II toxin-antitoxin system death-on-curing family toxin n=1 Tax=Agromyces sp. LY-1074 TaxID=3074080 RepID=UPI002866A8F9|nr:MULTISPECIES: Fic family protein [unclassified Agromyces]MDR5699865.1 Fic family protein [Agromyces sp. LY-1074]MDR5706323.1 Fic family protein [Agromyces sp. LY-1358]
MTEYLDPEDVEQLIASAGFHYRGGNRHLLLSALATPLPVFGEEVYPELEHKAAVLLIAINRDHPLADGNKRLSWIVAKAFLALNGLDLATGVREGDRFVRSVADESPKFEEVAQWITHHTTVL